jgi:Tfp pilus assembly protein PilF
MGGRLRLADGDLDGAREHLERSVVMASGRVSPSLALADLELREGKYAAAQALIDDARSIASVPRQHSSVLGAQIDYFRQRGMFQKAAETTDELYAVDASFRNPVNLMMGTFINRIEDYVNAGRDAQILSQLADYATQFQPPIDELVQVGYLRYYLFKGDLESAREPAQRVRGVIENFNREDMEYLNDLAQSRMLELAGDLPAAIAAIETSIEKYSQSVQSVQASSDSNIMQNKLAEFLYRTGNADGARDILEEHLIPRPADPRANLTLAKVLAQQGDTDSAKQSLQIALDAWTEADEGYAPAQEARDLAAQW